MSLRDRIKQGRARRFLAKVPKEEVLRVAAELILSVANDGKIDDKEWARLRAGLRTIADEMSSVEAEAEAEETD